MDELIAFVRQQLDEDERVARLWPEREWHAVGDEVVTPDDLVVAESGAAQHIARWDPARVLDEVEAKRERLDWIESQLRDDATDETAQWLAKLEARPYAGREGYSEDWRP